MKLAVNDHNVIFHFLQDGIYVKKEVPGDFDIKILFSSEKQMLEHLKVGSIDDIHLDDLVNSTQTIMRENNQP